MGSKLLTLFSFHLLHLLLFFHGTKADSNNIVTGLICKAVNCGYGTCTASNNTLFPPFDCECSPGWKKLQIGSITFPPCIVPNCTLDLNCGGSAPPPPPPPILLPNLTNPDPCSYTFCGDGTCVRTGGSGYICKCNEGSANLLNHSGAACAKNCAIGADCLNLGLPAFGPWPSIPLLPVAQPPPPPPPTPNLSQTPPPPTPNLSQTPASTNGDGPKGDGNFARDRPVLTTLLLLATLIPWI